MRTGKRLLLLLLVGSPAAQMPNRNTLYPNSNMEYSFENLTFYLIFILPGLISIKVYSLLYATNDKTISETLFDSLFYTALNIILLLPAYIIIMGFYDILGNFAIILLYGFMLFTSVGLPFILRYLYEETDLMKNTQLPYVTAWDYFFNMRVKCFIIFHLNDGTMIGGYYGNKSYSCSYPRNGDIYIQSVIKINKDGTFGEIIEGSKGLLITKEEYKFVELFQSP